MQTDNLVLRPNCLLTKYPLVFITGPRSVFFLERLGADLQDFLAAHGYRVLSPIMPFRDPKARADALSKHLKKLNEKQFHFFSGNQSAKELNPILSQYPGSTLTNPAKFAKDSPTPLNYRLHQLFCAIASAEAESYADTLPNHELEFFERILDHCIDLAENE